MFETNYERLVSLTALILVIGILWQSAHPTIKEVPVDKIVEIEKSCPQCAQCLCTPCPTCAPVTIKEIIKEPCPARKCVVTGMGAYRESNGTSWWWHNTTTNSQTANYSR